MKIIWECECGNKNESDLFDLPGRYAEDGCSCGRLIKVENVTEYDFEGVPIAA